MPRIKILVLEQIVRRSTMLDDPRYVFYVALLSSATREEYLGKVGHKVVIPPTYQVRMGAMREYKYVRDNRRWIEEVEN